MIKVCFDYVDTICRSNERVDFPSEVEKEFSKWQMTIAQFA